MIVTDFRKRCYIWIFPITNYLLIIFELLINDEAFFITTLCNNGFKMTTNSVSKLFWNSYRLLHKFYLINNIFNYTSI